jgi:hypothetical protein
MKESRVVKPTNDRTTSSKVNEISLCPSSSSSQRLEVSKGDLAAIPGHDLDSEVGAISWVLTEYVNGGFTKKGSFVGYKALISRLQDMTKGQPMMTEWAVTTIAK